MPTPRKLHDEFFKRAKAEGYLARSAYKLIEINDKKRIIRSGDKVIDLGCAPGSWLQVTEDIIGDEGLALGIDLQEITHNFGPSIGTFVGDAFKTDPAELLEFFRGARADALISDMAPNTTGHGDDLLSARLCRRVLELAPYVLRPGGHLVMKVLEGGDMPELLNETRAVFRECGATKPAASRDISREIFIWAKGFSGATRKPAPPAAKNTKPTSAGWGRENEDMGGNNGVPRPR